MMYEGGRPAKNRVIEEQAHRPASELVADVRDSAARLQLQLDVMDTHDWARLTQPAGPDTVTQTVLAGLMSRWREVEVHHVDLGLGYESANWSQAYVRRDLATIIETLPTRVRDVPHELSVQIVTQDDGTIWTVNAYGVRRGRHNVGPEVRGAGHALLAWLLGRATAEIVVSRSTAQTGDPLALPHYFPFG